MGYTTILPEPMWDPVTPNVNPSDWEDDEDDD
jgi:hypothetical protein